MNKKFIGVILLALAFAAAFSACKSKEKTAAPEAAAGFKPALDTKTEASINVAGHYSNFEALEEEFNRFAAFYPNVKMTYTALDSYNNNIATALSGDEAPDIFFTYPTYIGKENYQAVFDAAEDLSDPKLNIDLSCVRESLIYKDAEGHIPMVPVFASTYGMLVNEKIFEKEKIAVPETLSQLISASEALQKAGYTSPIMAHSSLLLYPMYFPYFCGTVMGNDAALADLNELKEGSGEYMRSALELAADYMGRGFMDLESCDTLENDYQAVILRFFEGDVPMMMASGGTVSGTEKRQSMSEAYTADPFTYSFRPVPSTEEGGYMLTTVSLEFSVNKNSKNLDMANEFMRFLVSTAELNRMAQGKRMLTPCTDMSYDGIYSAFGSLDASHVINQSTLGLNDAADVQVRRAGRKVSLGEMTVDEAVAAYGTLEEN